MTSTARSRPGVTLVELVVALTILAIASTFVLIEMRQRDQLTDVDEITGLVGEARRAAIATGRPQVLQVGAVLAADPVSSTATRTPHREAELIAYPDGSVLADSALHIERLSGLTLIARGPR